MLKAVHIIMGVAILVVGFMGIASVIYLWASTSQDWANTSLDGFHTEKEQNHAAQ